jgi:hypothetical protein
MRRPTKKKVKCRWKNCDGKCPPLGGTCDSCGRTTPRPPREKTELFRLQLVDGDGETRFFRTYEVRRLSEWPDLREVLETFLIRHSDTLVEHKELDAWIMRGKPSVTTAIFTAANLGTQTLLILAD